MKDSASLLLKPSTMTVPDKKFKHVMLIVLESTRADVIGKRIGDIEIAPNINALAKTGSSISEVYSHSGYTTTSLKAIFNQSLIAANAHSVVRDFTDHGYQFSVFSGQSESFGDIAKDTQMKKLARVFFDADSAKEERVYGNADASSIRLDAARVFAEFDKDSHRFDWHRPQLVYMNLQCAHFPYSHSKMPHLILDKPIPRDKITHENKAWLQKSYWNAVQYADQVIGQVIDSLKQQGVWDDTVLIITGDHGESLFEDGFLGHGHKINTVQTEVPLVINKPGITIEQPVGQKAIMDIARAMVGMTPVPHIRDNGKKAVFQYIGSVSTPAQAGIVEKDHVQTVLDFRTREIYFSDLKRWIDVNRALHEPRLAARSERMIDTWETLNWLSHRNLRKNFSKFSAR